MACTKTRNSREQPGTCTEQSGTTRNTHGTVRNNTEHARNSLKQHGTVWQAWRRNKKVQYVQFLIKSIIIQYMQINNLL